MALSWGKMCNKVKNITLCKIVGRSAPDSPVLRPPLSAYGVPIVLIEANVFEILILCMFAISDNGILRHTCNSKQMRAIARAHTNMCTCDLKLVHNSVPGLDR